MRNTLGVCGAALMFCGACGDEVPLGKDQNAAGQSGASGFGASSGTGGGPGSGGVGGFSGTGTGGFAATGGFTGTGGLGATGGSAGTGGVGGTGDASGSGGGGVGGGTGGTGATGGTGGTGGTGAGGSAGTGGFAGTGGAGGTGSCPVLDRNIQREILGSSPRGLAVSGQMVYFSDTAAGTINRVAMPLEQPELLGSAQMYPGQAEAFENPDSLAIDGGFLYWRAREGVGVWRMPVSGGAPSLVANITGILPFNSAAGMDDVITVQNDKVYWVQGPNSFGVIDVEFRLYEAPTTGGTATQLAAFTSDENNFDKPYQPLSVDADATSLFFNVYGPVSSELMRIPLSGGPPESLFGTALHLEEVGPDVYVVASGLVWRIPKDGSTQNTITMGLDPNDHFLFSQGVTTLGPDVFVSYMGTTISSGLGCCPCGWVTKVPQQGTNVDPTIVWSGTGRPVAMAADDGSFLAVVDVDNDSLLILTP